MNVLDEPALRLFRTPVQGVTGAGALFTNVAAGIEVGVPWFESRYWIARGAVVANPAGRGAVTVFEQGGRRFVLRHYLRGGLPARISTDRFVWLGEARVRAVAELRLTMRLHAEGLPVPMPLAARYERQGASYRADLITEYLPDTRTLAQRLAEGDVELREWTAIGRCIRSFQDKGICHADLNAHNVLLRKDGAVFLIDFDRCRRRHPGLWRDANLARLRRSLDALEDRRSEPRFDEVHWDALLAGWF